MQTQPHRRAYGFTLIELLVVIAIIAVLAGAGLTAGQAALQKARKASTLNTATAIEQAVNNFFNEYGYLPANETVDTTYATNEAAGKAIIVVLTGKETSTTPLNTKAINFLAVKEGKKIGTTGGRDGMIYDTTGLIPDGIYDPWGGSYKIGLNLDYNETLIVKPKAAAANKTINARHVAVWSDGADGAGAAVGKTIDDVTTW
jgi:prepilin-type N-terminal cleavage/methylation domain-containing protein